MNSKHLEKQEPLLCRKVTQTRSTREKEEKWKKVTERR